MSELDEAKDFLYRYPWAIRDTDDPIAIIKSLADKLELLTKTKKKYKNSYV